ncbi:nucleolar complex protein 3 [Periplaneta americana]|uniref:nucleolar complex protein 3 n=1 Tax=Periplaneta americana TaxID=6978 RepID=UPI0037E83FF7
MTMKKSKVRISKVKQKNLKHTKLSKQGKLKNKRHKKKLAVLHKRNKGNNVQAKLNSAKEEEEEQSDHGEELLQMVEKEDLDFLKNAVASHSYSLLNHIRYSEGKQKGRKRKKEKDDEDIKVEKEYEDSASWIEPKRTKHLLPIKTKDGLVHRSVSEEFSENEAEPEEVPDKPMAEEEEVDSDAELEQELKAQENDEIDTSQPVSTAELLAAREEALCKRKLLIGVLASGLLEDPQLKNKNFKRLLDLMNEQTPELRITVRKLVTMSLLEVFKDVIPSYQIKHQDNQGVKLKKETLQLQNYEKTLLSSYRNYLQRLEKLVSVLNKKRGNSRVISQQEIKLGELALRCMCDLLVTHSYFNFSQNLVQMLVPYLNHHIPSVRETCANAMKTLFKNDKKGEISLEIVRRINHLVKSRSHSVHPEVLEVLLSLRIKEVNLDKEKEDDLKQKKLMKHKQRLLTLSKKERKRSKQLEALEKELLETKAEENKQAKQKYLTEITKIIFTIYFRVLKKAPSSKILSITLEGLARYAHCINMEFYQDIVNVLNQLLEQEQLGHREQLHCIQTVFTLLSGQGDFLNIDPFRFYKHLYCNLLIVNAGVNHRDLPVVLKTLNLALIHRRKRLTQQRIFAFTKRLATMAIQLLHNGSLGCLAIIRTIIQLNRSVDILLDPDSSVGQGVYFPELEDPEYCNASNSALWELVALQHHYHPTVSKFARNILLGVPASGEGCLPPELTKLSAEELYKEFDPSEMVFRPTIPIPKKVEAKSRPPKSFRLKNESFADYVKEISEKHTEGPLDFFENMSAT